MATQLEIANMALSHLGVMPLANIAPANTEPGARQVNVWMTQSRDTALAVYPWTFATVRKRLVPKTFPSIDAPSYTADWLNAYFYPCDCILMQYVVDPALASTIDLSTGTPYAVEQNPSNNENEEPQLILTNADDATAVYTTNALDWTELPGYFVQPLTYVLAANMAFAITTDIALRDRLLRAYEQVVQAASAQDARAVQTKEPTEPPVIRGRR